MKLQQAKKYPFFLYSSLNNIKRERHKSEEQKSALQNIAMLYKARKKLSNYLMIIIELHLRLNI